MEVYKISENDIECTADMTRQLFEDEPSIKHLTTDEFEKKVTELFDEWM